MELLSLSIGLLIWSAVCLAVLVAVIIAIVFYVRKANIKK